VARNGQFRSGRDAPDKSALCSCYVQYLSPNNFARFTLPMWHFYLNQSTWTKLSRGQCSRAYPAHYEQDEKNGSTDSAGRFCGRNRGAG
jgi:hypothetical protein